MGQEMGIWISPNIQATWALHWSSTKFQNKSVIAMTNRVVENEASIYCCGSTSMTTHFEKIVILLIISLYFLYI